MNPNNEEAPNTRVRDALLFAIVTGPTAIAASFDPELQAARKELQLAGIFITMMAVARGLRYLEDQP